MPSQFSSIIKEISLEFNFCFITFNCIDLNSLLFNKLRRLLNYLQSPLIYDEISANKGIMKIKVYCYNKFVLNGIKRRASKWIMYQIKESPQNDVSLHSNSAIINFADKNDIESEMLENLSVNEWQILKCLGDGNCLFRAISNQVYGKYSFYNKVRSEIVDFIKLKRSRFENMIKP